MELQLSSRKKGTDLYFSPDCSSKKACGIAFKPKEDIVDIYAADTNNDLAGIEYVEDIYRFYKTVEVPYVDAKVSSAHIFLALVTLGFDQNLDVKYDICIWSCWATI
ncbi:G2/mitotic-specific cyclin-1-like [Euphorbia lathyris]|uniref:G2/mitotic-specific cyclin-1-like n=1 Tax=Euphorbia lathyris TaxID=212925 RepID=UPI003313CF6D